MQEIIPTFNPQDSYKANVNEVLEKLLNDTATIALGNSIIILDKLRLFLDEIPTLDQETLITRTNEMKTTVDEYASKYIETLNKIKPSFSAGL